MLRLSLVTPPLAEPVSLIEAREYLRVDGDDEDLLIGSLVSAARARVEEYASLAVLTQTWDAYIGYLEPTLYLPRTPLVAVTEVAYTPADGAEQPLPPEHYASVPRLGFVAFRPTTPAATSYRVRFTAGWTLPALVPGTVRQAILRTLANLYEFREDQTSGANYNPVPLDAQVLLNPYRRWTL